MHVLEGSREAIEAQLKLSLDAFFDFIQRFRRAAPISSCVAK